ncbi:MAG: hypothetical protein KF791_12560 [Verrucomicrobiae bacterium]|nr:hypothetical protein [Verrucomicrobiae bacterium]
MIAGCPTSLDTRRAGVNNDRTDALELATRLDRYRAGNDKALSIVHVPTEAEEQKRARKRQRQQLREQRLSLAAQGRCLMLLNGRRETNHWWKSGRWEVLKATLEPWLVERLEVFHPLILAMDQAVRASGEGHADLSITTSGNRRLRTERVELAWRILLFQPRYYLVRKWHPVLLNPKAHARARKRAIVAFARQLLVCQSLNLSLYPAHLPKSLGLPGVLVVLMVGFSA